MPRLFFLCFGWRNTENNSLGTRLGLPCWFLLGDLTHSRTGAFGSDQYEEEWKFYHSVIKESGVADKRPWLDLPGNHGECIKCLHFI